MSRMIHILDTLHNYCNKIVVCNIKQVGDIILYIKITKKKKKMYYLSGFNIKGGLHHGFHGQRCST